MSKMMIAVKGIEMPKYDQYGNVDRHYLPTNIFVNIFRITHMCGSWPENYSQIFFNEDSLEIQEDIQTVLKKIGHAERDLAQMMRSYGD